VQINNNQATIIVDLVEPAEEDVHLSGFDQLLDNPLLQSDREDIGTIDIKTDLARISQPSVTLNLNLTNFQKTTFFFQKYKSVH
jgi:hypothetical protein